MDHPKYNPELRKVNGGGRDCNRQQHDGGSYYHHNDHGYHPQQYVTFSHGQDGYYGGSHDQHRERCPQVRSPQTYVFETPMGTSIRCDTTNWKPEETSGKLFLSIDEEDVDAHQFYTAQRHQPQYKLYGQQDALGALPRREKLQQHQTRDAFPLKNLVKNEEIQLQHHPHKKFQKLVADAEVFMYKGNSIHY